MNTKRAIFIVNLMLSFDLRLVNFRLGNFRRVKFRHFCSMKWEADGGKKTSAKKRQIYFGDGGTINVII